MVTPNGTNGINGFGGFDDERETLLHTALFKQVSSEEARELLPVSAACRIRQGRFHLPRGRHRPSHVSAGGRPRQTDQTILRQACAAAEHPRVRRSAGEIPVFDPHGGPRTASAVAMTSDTKVVWLEHDALFAWLDEHPRVAVDMLQVLAHPHA